MDEIELCEACGTPLFVSREFSWNANGTITLSGNPNSRMVFFESDSIDELFGGIEELIGFSIANIVIESKSRDTRGYIERLLTPEKSGFMPEQWRGGMGVMDHMTQDQKAASLAVIRSVTQDMTNLSRIYGYGDQRLGTSWESGGDYPWRSQLYHNPYSLLFAAADNLGTNEVFEKTEMWVSWEEAGKDTYNIVVYPEKHPVDIKERLKKKRFDPKPGGIDYERCSGCGLPHEVAQLEYNLRDGTYFHPDTGWRMAIFGPTPIDAVFKDLEAELGETIPETVMEAQRRYIKSAWGVERWNRSGATFQKIIAVRGLGNQVKFEGDRSHLEMRIENSCLHLPIIGTIQALVELAYRAESSRVEWELHGDGDLDLNVIVR
ncbi:MAG: hypothetical protein JW854_11180 [Actinobacteria bacterium]|nr:hypothetical protein [Actinomycetota bacterium]